MTGDRHTLEGRRAIVAETLGKAEEVLDEYAEEGLVVYALEFYRAHVPVGAGASVTLGRACG